jgi:anti-anti-sigma factor
MFAERRTVVTVNGTLDARSAPDLERIVADALTPTVDVIVLDLAGVVDADAAAVAALLRIEAACTDWTAGLRVVAGMAVRAAVAADEQARAILPLE